MKDQRGFTLVEVLITILINVIVIAGLLVVFSNFLSFSSKNQLQDKMYSDMQIIMEMMRSDIQRAGFWGNAISDISTNSNNNPFMNGTDDITVNDAQNCLTFTYDSNKDGLLPVISASADDERYGYRLLNQALQSRMRGAPFSCTAPDTAWENMTDNAVYTITNLTFTKTTQNIPNGQSTNVVQVRTIAISMTGQLVSNPDITITLTTIIRVRNDKYIPSI